MYAQREKCRKKIDHVSLGVRLRVRELRTWRSEKGQGLRPGKARISFSLPDNRICTTERVRERERNRVREGKRERKTPSRFFPCYLMNPIYHKDPGFRPLRLGKIFPKTGHKTKLSLFYFLERVMDVCWLSISVSSTNTEIAGREEKRQKRWM